MIVFDDVLIPWENVFFYRHTRAAQFIRATLHRYWMFPYVQRHQRWADFLLGLAYLNAQQTGVKIWQGVREKIAQLACYREGINAHLTASIELAERSPGGLLMPNQHLLYTGRVHACNELPAMVHLARELCGCQVSLMEESTSRARRRAVAREVLPDRRRRGRGAAEAVRVRPRPRQLGPERVDLPRARRRAVAREVLPDRRRRGRGAAEAVRVRPRPRQLGLRGPSPDLPAVRAGAAVRAPARDLQQLRLRLRRGARPRRGGTRREGAGVKVGGHERVRPLQHRRDLSGAEPLERPLPGRRRGQDDLPARPGRAGSRDARERRDRRPGRPGGARRGEHRDVARRVRGVARAHRQLHDLPDGHPPPGSGLPGARRAAARRLSGLHRPRRLGARAAGVARRGDGDGGVP